MQPANVDSIPGKMLFGFFVLVLLFGVVARIVALHRTEDRYLKQIGGKLAMMCTTMGFLGIVLFFFSFENIRLFGGRFWYPIWAIGLLVWIVTLVRFIQKEVPHMRERDQKRKDQMKYMPARKK